jgi:YYY domain-containing protein
MQPQTVAHGQGEAGLSRTMNSRRYIIFFIIAIVLGGAFRFYRLDWGRPGIFHPDEARVSYAIGDINKQVSVLRSRIAQGKGITLRERIDAFNPHFFAYGSLPFYLIRSTQNFVRNGYLGLNRILSSDLFVVGRAWSAFFDTLTILIVYLLGSFLFSRRTAALAALFFAFTVFHIQLSHFLTVDMMLVSFVVLAVYFCARIMEQGRLRDYLLAGLFAGLALATKFSASPILITFLFAHVAFCWRERRLLSVGQWGKLIVGLVSFGAAFAVVEPYFFLDHKEFMRQLKEQRNMVQGRWSPPWTYQYEHTIKGFYQIKNLVVYCMGAPLGIAVLGSVVYLVILWLKRPDRKVLLLLAWLVPVVCATASFKVKFIRYFAPLIPFLCILGAQGICVLYEKARDRGWGLLVRVLAGLVIAFSLFYSLSYLNIYRHEDTRIAASNWVYKNIPKGACILGETWEFGGIPVGTSEGNPGRYRYKVKKLDIYKSDRGGKARTLSRELAEGDLVAIPTKRMYGSVLRIPERYPVTTNYYRLLFEERLGYELVKSFTSYPRLFNIEFDDDYADESFTVYDHPKVLLFRKVVHYPAEYIEKLIREEQKRNYWPVLEDALGANEYNRPREKEEKVVPALDGYTPKEYSGVKAVVLWLVLVELLGFIALPLTASFLGNLRDRGYAFSKVLAIALIGYMVWLAASLGIMPFSRSLILVAVLVLLLLSLLRARGECGWGSFLRAHRNNVIATEAVFLGFFGLFMLFRLYNPDIFWSESSMDFSFINSVLRTRYFPPLDPWCAGIYLNYYYYGHYLVAMLTKMSGIPPYITYNLSFCLIPALVITGVFSIVYNLSGRVRYGVLGGVFAGIIGNIDGFFLLVDTYPWREKFYAFFYMHMPTHSEAAYRYFRCAHEVIKNTVHEYPFWSFIFVDLHAHVIAMPFAVLLLALGLNLIMSRRSWFGALGIGARGAGNFLIAAVILGMMVPINTWDFPTYLMILGLMVLAGEALAWRTHHRHMPLSEYTIWEDGDFVARVVRITVRLIRFEGAVGRIIKILLRVAVFVAFLAAAALALYSPFFQFFGREGMGIGTVKNLTTWPGALLRFFGFFLFIIASFFLIELIRFVDGRRGFVKRLLFVVLLLFAGILPWLIFNQTGTRNYASLSMALVIFLAGLVVLGRNRHDRPAVYAIILVLCGCAIIAACEIFHIRDFLQGGSHKRMNTIFKFYLPAWFLFSVGGAYFVFRVFSYPSRWRRRVAGKRVLLIIWCVAFLVLFAASLVFTVMGPRSRTIGHDNYQRSSLEAPEGIIGKFLPRILSHPTLNGLAYMKVRQPDGYDAIFWLNENVKGQPVIAEATRQDYRYEYSRISSNTGLPAVLGWWSHIDQRGYRFRDVRKRDVFKLYESDDPYTLSKIIAKYNIDYVFVGDTERRNYLPAQLDKFATLQDLFRPVFKDGAVTIYQTLYFPPVLKEVEGAEGAETQGTPITVPRVNIFELGYGEDFGEYNEPRGIALDTKGNIYVADFRNYRIQKFDKNGIFVTAWGEEGDYPGQFKDPCDVAVGKDGTVYVADTFNNRIQIFDGSGKLINYFEGNFFAPRSLALDGEGRIWVADTGNGLVKVFSREGRLLKTIGGKGKGKGEFDRPNGIAIDREGRVYVADVGNRRVQILDKNGDYLGGFTVDGWEKTVFNEPYLDVDEKGDIYVTDPPGHRVLKYSRGGELRGVLKPMEGGKPLLLYPMGIAVEDDGEAVFVVDCRNNRIRKFSKRDFK